jgi:hypothetical protein
VKDSLAKQFMQTIKVETTHIDDME